MSGFLALETSNHDGRPVLLYEFSRGDVRANYASSDQGVALSDGSFYVPVPIKDGGVVQKGTAPQDVLEISTARNVAVVEWFRFTPPSDTVYVVLRRFHWGDPEAVIIWFGQVVSVAEGAEESAVIKCQAVSYSLRRGGLRMPWLRGCPHTLYDQNCRADKDAHAHPTTITAIADDHFQIASAVDSAAFWIGGIIGLSVSASGVGVVIGSSTVQEQRLIYDLVGLNVYPYGDMDGYTVGQAIVLYPGCKRTSAWCLDFFNNLDNFGGFPFMPYRSPFDGDTVF